MTTTQSITEIFGPVITSYTRQDAIRDKVLFSVEEELTRNFYKFPVCITQGINQIIEDSCLGWYCDRKGILHDIIYMSRMHIVKRLDESTHLFEVVITSKDSPDPESQEAIFCFKLQVHAGDEGEPVITIMLLDED